MNRALVLKEWRQARAGVLATGAMLTAIWMVTFSPVTLLLGGSLGGSLGAHFLLVVIAGLQLPLAQWASESILGTRDVLVFRATGPRRAFRAKLAVGLAAATLLGVGPVLVWTAWQALTFPGAEGADWSRVLRFVQLGTLTWALWGVGTLACQLRRGWPTRIVALLLGILSVLGLALRGMERLASAPPWTDWLVPLGSAVVGLFFAWCASRAFVAGVDDELPLRDGPGLALGLGASAALVLPLCALGPCVSSSVTERLASEYRHVALTKAGELGLVRPPSPVEQQVRFGSLEVGLPDDLYVTVLDPSWMDLGWPAPTVPTDPSGPGDHRILEGNQRRLTEGIFHGTGIESHYDYRSRTVRVFDRRGDRPYHEVLDLGWSPRTYVLAGSASSLLADVGHGTLTRVRERDGRVELDALELPGGDRLVGVEQLVDRAAATIGWIPPFTRGGLLLRGDRGLYRVAWNEEPVLQPYVSDDEDRWVPWSRVGQLVRFQTGYAEYDGLDPVIEVRDAHSGEPLLTARLAPRNSRTARLKALTMATGFLHPTVASLTSFLDHRPWDDSPLPADLALAGGRRPWLLALRLVFAAWLAWRVRRETRAWGRSPWLGRFWIAITLVLGLPGWLLFRLVEPSARASLVDVRERDVAGRDRGLEVSSRQVEVAR